LIYILTTSALFDLKQTKEGEGARARARPHTRARSRLSLTGERGGGAEEVEEMPGFI